MEVGCFVLSSIDEASAQTAGQRPSFGGCLGGGESVEVKLRSKDDLSRASR